MNHRISRTRLAVLVTSLFALGNDISTIKLPQCFGKLL